VKPIALAITMALVACNTPDEPTVPRAASKLAYDAPAEWMSTEARTRESITTVWTPKTNERKESITVIRAKAHLRAADQNTAFLGRLLVEAQRAIPHHSITSPSSTVRLGTIDGVMLEIDFTPRGLAQRYHRIHAVALEGDELVHVFYTSLASVVASRESFDLVVRSLHREEV